MKHRVHRSIIALILVIGLGIMQLPHPVQAAASDQMPQQASIINNGDFETGNLSGWSLFTTSNGVAFTNVVPFDTSGDGNATYSARFGVGQLTYQGDDYPEGGGIYQNVYLVNGDLNITADISSNNPYNNCNLFGGEFQLIVDGIVVDNHNFDLICNYETKRSTLNADISIDTIGLHEIRFAVVRPATLSGVVDYLDNIVLSGSATLTSLDVSIDIKPGSDTNPINPNSSGRIPIAILSTPDFSAPSMVDISSLTFGPSGSEASLAFCNGDGEDVNGDGLLDLVCHFYTQVTGFQVGDLEGILKGETIDNTPLEGHDVVNILP